MTIDELAQILIDHNGLCVIHLNPFINGFNKSTITKPMGLPQFMYKSWLEQVRSFYTCPLIIEFKFKLF